MAIVTYADRVFPILCTRFSVFQLDESNLSVLRKLCDAYGFDVDKFERNYQFTNEQFPQIQKARDLAQFYIWKEFSLYLHSLGYAVPDIGDVGDTWRRLHEYCDKNGCGPMELDNQEEEEYAPEEDPVPSPRLPKRRCEHDRDE